MTNSTNSGRISSTTRKLKGTVALLMSACHPAPTRFSIISVKASSISSLYSIFKSVIVPLPPVRRHTSLDARKISITGVGPLCAGLLNTVKILLLK